jgi:hypothetical protein
VQFLVGIAQAGQHEEIELVELDVPLPDLYRLAVPAQVTEGVADALEGEGVVGINIEDAPIVFYRRFELLFLPVYVTQPDQYVRIGRIEFKGLLKKDELRPTAPFASGCLPVWTVR